MQIKIMIISSNTCVILILLAKFPCLNASSIDDNGLHHSIDPHWNRKEFEVRCEQQTIEVRYPFIQPNKNESLEPTVTCYNGNAVMEINSIQYYVRSINYDSQVLVVAPVVIVDNLENYSSCLGGFTPFYSNIKPFTHTKNNFNIGLSFCLCAVGSPYSRLAAVSESFKYCCYSLLVDDDEYMPSCGISDHFYTIKEANDFEVLFQSGFEIAWMSHEGVAYSSSHPSRALIPAGVAVSCIVCLLMGFRRWRKSIKSLFHQKSKSKKDYEKKIEKFMVKYGSVFPERYSYLDVQNMTSSFSDKLGQGGYGSVYKGKLADGRPVAVKVLNHSKTGSKEFLNEVICISCTYHTNIVTLLGFCMEDSKRLLIYEYMPNGSLEKFIHHQNELNQSLNYETLMKIAVGIAHGLEYLHHGCNIGILHFDIKPHNILLDNDFIPKIADFGLAKLSHSPEKIIRMLGARGTIGYIAPEVFSHNYGGVSCKSDVYSYGMMILEIVGGRKNLEVAANTSEIYFPHWIYKKLENCGSLTSSRIPIVNEDAEEIARRMILAGLWCIQTNPGDRPSMRKVLEMLEGRIPELMIPPMPILSSPSRSPQLHSPAQDDQTREMSSFVVSS